LQALYGLTKIQQAALVGFLKDTECADHRETEELGFAPSKLLVDQNQIGLMRVGEGDGLALTRTQASGELPGRCARFPNLNPRGKIPGPYSDERWGRWMQHFIPDG
jgi:hypothetical protein